mmetsp:Transcript_35764/g.83169  ORF Transcript_35764/g.83169 Transcript_35764/m.83169 type:complete len:216 (+) Transcript_35764:386-1033(+)
MMALTPARRARACASTWPPQVVGSRIRLQYSLKSSSRNGSKSSRWSRMKSTQRSRNCACASPPSPLSWSANARKRHAPSASTSLIQRSQAFKSSWSRRNARSQPCSAPSEVPPLLWASSFGTGAGFAGGGLSVTAFRFTGLGFFLALLLKRASKELGGPLPFSSDAIPPCKPSDGISEAGKSAFQCKCTGGCLATAQHCAIHVCKFFCQECLPQL